jgi:NADH-quinone oxidoreductase subunit F
MPEIPFEKQAILSYRHDPHSTDLKTAIENRAYEGLKAALKLQPVEVTEIVKQSGLRGRGGAGFPAGMKWSFMPKEVAPGRPHVIAINADESEPGTFKDRDIMSLVPHKLIEGALIVSWANHAHICFIYIRGEYTKAYNVLNHALDEAKAANLVGKNILGSGFDCEIIVHRGAGAYICGEETALLESLEGKRGHPRTRPPYAVTYGAFGLPTVVNNVETIAALPYILANGAQAFRQFGTEKSPGSKIYSVSGHVNKPGNYECELGITLRELLNTAGGMLDGHEFKACFPGGCSAALIGKEHLDTPMDFESLAQAGSMLGSGGVIVMDETADMVRVLWRVSKFYMRESCGKCTPCHQGTWWLTKIFTRIIEGKGTPEDIDTLHDITHNMLGTCFCLLGDSAAEPVKSLLNKFSSEFDRYIKSPVTVTVPS